MKKRKSSNKPYIWPDEFTSFDAETAWKFVLNCKTWNESEAESQLIPDLPYLKAIVEQWVECVEHGTPLVIEKCRRMVVSWLWRALELWLMGLSRCDVKLCGIKAEASASHCWRYQHIYTTLQRDFPEWNLPSSKTNALKGSRHLEMFSLANGSLADTHHQDAGSLQGAGYRLVVIEELSGYSYPAAIWAQAKILTQGAAGSGKRGTVLAVCNTNLNEDWQLIKRHNGLTPTHIPGMSVSELQAGGKYMHIQYYADPGKDSKWLEATRIQMQDAPRDFDREILMKEIMTDGKPVYPMFIESIHAPIELQGKKISHKPRAMLFAGWDAGTASLQPAFVLAQQLERADPKLPLAVQVLMEVVSPEVGMSLEQFIPFVAQRVAEEYPSVDWTAVQHFGDPAGDARSGINGKTAFQLMRELGIPIVPSTNALAVRTSAVAKLLNSEIDNGLPLFCLNRTLCPTLLNGFLGGYRLQKFQTGSTHRYGQPIKDPYSHPHDALQYLAVGFWEAAEANRQIINRIKYREPNNEDDD